MTDYQKAIWIPNNNYTSDTGKKTHLVLHGTAGGSSAQDIAAFFRGTQGGNNPVTSNYIVDQAGVVVQCVLEKDGAWAQGGGVLKPPFQNNPNSYCISIEHVKSATDNSSLLTNAQMEASFLLIKDICTRNNIPIENIIPHNAITDTTCPGPYPWQSLQQFLKGPDMNTPPTTAQESEARDCWHSTGYIFQAAGVEPPPTGSGIFQSWLSAWVHQGRHYGPPLTREYNTNNWNGESIIAQEFAHARCEYANGGVASWYGTGGKLN